MTPFFTDNFYVVGELFVGNLGIEVACKGTPKASIQKPGMWIQVMTLVHARFDKFFTPHSPKYEQVEIFLDNESIVQFPVK